MVVSHDRYFLDRTIDYILRFEHGTDDTFRIREYPGNYSAFLEIRNRENVEEKKSYEKPSPARSVERESSRRKLSFKERRELAEVEGAIAAAEERKTAAEAEIATRGSDHVLVAQIYEELQALNLALEHDLDRWFELSHLEEE